MAWGTAHNRLWVQLSSHWASFGNLWRAYRDGKSCFKLIRGGHLGTSFGTGLESKTHDGENGSLLHHVVEPRRRLARGASSTSAVAGTAVASKREAVGSVSWQRAWSGPRGTTWWVTRKLTVCVLGMHEAPLGILETLGVTYRGADILSDPVKVKSLLLM